MGVSKMVQLNLESVYDFGFLLDLVLINQFVQYGVGRQLVLVIFKLLGRVGDGQQISPGPFIPLYLPHQAHNLSHLLHLRSFARLVSGRTAFVDLMMHLHK